MEASTEGTETFLDSAIGADFGKFLTDLASLLTLEIVLQLATYFTFPPSQHDQLQRSMNPGQQVIVYLQEKGIFSSTDISKLIDALEYLGLHGVREKVTRSFEKHLGGIPRRMFHDILAKVERFCKELKTQYERLYFSVRPVPFELRFKKNVDDVFINSVIEVMNESKREDHPDRWKKISSYRDILTMFPDAKRLFIQGEPGYGKSILLQKLAYDWSTTNVQHPHPIKIFILLRLKDLEGMKSIYDSVRMLLPQESDFTAKMIMDILKNGKVSTVFALDGYDEYSDVKKAEFDIPKIIKGEMFSSFVVLIATRPSDVHKLHDIESKTFRLTGFDKSMQKEYIEKVLEAGKAKTDQIMVKLNENSVLGDLCEVPLSLALFTHIVDDESDNQVFSSVTSFFSHLIACFFSHLGNKDKRADSQTFKESDDGRIKLAKLAYVGLSCKNQKLLWNEDEILQNMDPDSYNQYVKVGLLLKEQKLSFITSRGSHAKDHLSNQTKVQFFHKTLQEYYAAIYITHQFQKKKIKDLKEDLKQLDVNNVSYLFRFLCGLDLELATVVINYLRGLGEAGEMFAMLCVIEQGGDGIDDAIKELCFRQINFFSSDSNLLRRSKIQLLQLASNRKIPIMKVCLVQCFKSVNVHEGALEFCSTLLPKLESLEHLEIADHKNLHNMAEDILGYACQCRALREVRFFGSNLGGNILILPQQFSNPQILNTLARQQCEVTWAVRDDFKYGKEMQQLSLNLQYGNWRHGHRYGRVLSNKDYNLRCSTVTCEPKGMVRAFTMTYPATFH